MSSDPALSARLKPSLAAMVVAPLVAPVTFSGMLGFLHDAREVVKSLRQYELAKFPLIIESLWYLGGSKNVFRSGGCMPSIVYMHTFFIVLKSTKNHQK